MRRDEELRGVVLESLGRILELERRVDSLFASVIERYNRTAGEVLAGLESEQKPFEIDPIFSAEPEAPRSETSDDAAYRESSHLLRLAAKKFINLRGRFHDLTPEIDEILRRYYPATEERLSCPPAPPPSASPAAETSSGGERCTVGGAGSCCESMQSFWVHYCGPGEFRYLYDEWSFCPWCGTKLGGEG